MRSLPAFFLFITPALLGQTNVGELRRTVCDGIPAEYGRKMGGVVELNTLANATPAVHRRVVLSGGSFETAAAFAKADHLRGGNLLGGSTTTIASIQSCGGTTRTLKSNERSQCHRLWLTLFGQRDRAGAQLCVAPDDQLLKLPAIFTPAA